MFNVKIRKKKDREYLLLYYVDPVTGREKSRSAETADRKAAERAAALWEAELLAAGGSDGSGWQMFKDRFIDEKLAFKSANTKASYITALNAFEKFRTTSKLSEVTSGILSGFAAKLNKDGYPHTTVKSYLTHLQAAFRWAARVNIIRQAPLFEMPETGKRTHSRGRPLTPREVGKMLKACRMLHPEDWRAWRRFVKLLWYSGLRLGEALILSWDSAPLRVQLEASPYPLVVIDAEAQKSRSDTAIPLAPDFFDWLSKTPPNLRRAFVADIRNGAGKRYTADKLSDEISRIGKTAGVVIEPGKEQHATAHDLRRTFATRWAKKVRPMTLQRMMRHTELSTTLKFYVGLSIEDVGSELWVGRPKQSKDPK